MPLILLPSFFTMAISQALIPIISKSYHNNNLNYAKTKLKQAIFISLMIGIPVTIFFELCPSLPLRFIYNTNQGIEYLKVLAPICLFHYIQAPLSSSLQAMGKAKTSMKGTLYGMIIRMSLLFILCHFKISLWGLVIATSVNILFVTIYDGINVFKQLKNN